MLAKPLVEECYAVAKYVTETADIPEHELRIALVEALQFCSVSVAMLEVCMTVWGKDMPASLKEQMVTLLSRLSLGKFSDRKEPCAH